MADKENLQRDLDQRIEGYRCLINNPSGNQSTILNINPDFLDEFASAGYITYGIDAFANPRFMTTELGREYAKEAYMTMCSELVKKDVEELFE